MGQPYTLRRPTENWAEGGAINEYGMLYVDLHAKVGQRPPPADTGGRRRLRNNERTTRPYVQEYSLGIFQDSISQKKKTLPTPSRLVLQDGMALPPWTVVNAVERPKRMTQAVVTSPAPHPGHLPVGRLDPRSRYSTSRDGPHDAQSFAAHGAGRLVVRYSRGARNHWGRTAGPHFSATGTPRLA